MLSLPTILVLRYAGAGCACCVSSTILGTMCSDIGSNGPAKLHCNIESVSRLYRVAAKQRTTTATIRTSEPLQSRFGKQGSQHQIKHAVFKKNTKATYLVWPLCFWTPPARALANLVVTAQIHIVPFRFPPAEAQLVSQDRGNTRCDPRLQ